MSVASCNPGQGREAAAPQPVLGSADSTSGGIRLRTVPGKLEADGPRFVKKGNCRFAACFHLELIFVFPSAALPGDAVCGMISYFEKWGSAVGMGGSGGTEIKGKSTQIIGSLLPRRNRVNVYVLGWVSMALQSRGGCPRPPRLLPAGGGPGQGLADRLWA